MRPVTDLTGLRIGIIGGTGRQGRGLGLRWARSGQSVILGSRDADRAGAVAAEVGEGATGAANEPAAGDADIIVVTVPWSAHAATVEALEPHTRGKIVIDCVNPIGFDEHGPYALSVPEGSATQQAQQLLSQARVVGAFHHVPAQQLGDRSIERIDMDVLVVGDDRVAVDLVVELAAAIPGLRGISAGRLRNAHQVEALTANLIAINRRYRAHAGIRVTDV